MFPALTKVLVHTCVPPLTPAMQTPLLGRANHGF